MRGPESSEILESGALPAQRCRRRPFRRGAKRRVAHSQVRQTAKKRQGRRQGRRAPSRDSVEARGASLARSEPNKCVRLLSRSSVWTSGRIGSRPEIFEPGRALARSPAAIDRARCGLRRRIRGRSFAPSAFYPAPASSRVASRRRFGAFISNLGAVPKQQHARGFFPRPPEDLSSPAPLRSRSTPTDADGTPPDLSS